MAVIETTETPVPQVAAKIRGWALEHWEREKRGNER
jgi:hypothetical protein